MTEAIVNPNPFRMLYDLLWQILEDSADFCELVKPGNRIKFTGNVSSFVKDQMGQADLPEVRILHSGGETKYFIAQGIHQCVRNLVLQMTTGDLRITSIPSDLEWIIFLALGQWPQRAGALTWKDETFVKELHINGSQTGIVQDHLGPGNRGWTTVWQCSVTCRFKTIHL